MKYSENLRNIKALFFDLDNTLCDVEGYFLGAFELVARYLSLNYSIPRKRVFLLLKKIWMEKTSMYPFLFNDLLNYFGIQKKDTLRKVVALFNDYRGDGIKLYPDVFPMLKSLNEKGWRIGLITDGNIKRQQRKIKLLGINPFFDFIIYTKKLKSKPSHLPFKEAINKLGGYSPSLYYVGDNPLVDFAGAKKVGIRTIRVLRGEFANFPGDEFVDFEIKNLWELLNIIGK